MSSTRLVGCLLAAAILLHFSLPGRAAPTVLPTLVLQNGHARSVRAVAFSPDGRLLASGSEDETACLWNVARRRVVATLVARGAVRDGLRYDATVNAVAFSPDGRRVATGHHDGTVHLWSVDSGKEMAVLSGPADAVTSVAFTPDGRILAAGSDDSHVYFWAAAGASKPKAIPLPSSVNGVAFSPDGRLLAAACGNGTVVLLAPDGRLLATLPTSAGSVAAVSFSPRGRTLAAVTGLGEVAAFDVASRRRRYLRRVVESSVGTGLAFSPDGRRIAVSAAAAAYLVDAAGGRVLATLSEHDRAANAVAWSPDGRLVAGASSASAVRLWDAASGREEAPLAGHSSPAYALCVSPDGSVFAAGAQDGSLSLWDLATGRLRAHHRWAASCMAAALHPDDRTVAVALRTGTVALWDADTGAERVLEPGAGLDHEIDAVAFSPDGRTLAAGGADPEIRLFDVASGRVRARLPSPRGEVDALDWSPDGKHLASGDLNGNLTVWDVAERKPLQQRRLQSRTTYDRCYSVAYSPDGKRLAAGGEDGTAQVWDLDFDDGPRVMAGLEMRLVRAVRFSPDGGLLAATLDDDVLLFDAASGKRVRSLSGHIQEPTDLAFLPGRSVLASAGLDATIRFWDIRSGHPLATAIPLDDGNNWVVTAPDGRFDGSADGQGLIEWRLGDRRYALDQFFNEFYTPGLLARVLGAPGAHATAVRTRALPAITRLKPPPSVSIIAPAGGSHLSGRSVSVRVQVADEGGGVSRPALYRNGHHLSGRLCQAPGTDRLVWTVPLEHGVNDLRATACNAAGDVESRGDEVRVYCDAPPLHPPTLYVFAVGIDRYRSGLTLGFAADDARAIARYFKPGLFARVQPTLLLNRQADKRSVVAALQAIGREATAQDTVIIYLAGHGALEGELFYFLPYDVQPATDESLRRTGLSQVELGDALSGIAAARQILILDACHAGASATALGRLVASRDALGTIRAQERLAHSSGTFLVAASTARQYAKEFPELGHGVLTYAILRGLGEGGKPAAGVNRQGQVTVDALLRYLSDEVPTLTERYHGGRQDVVQYSTGQDFPLVVAK